MTKPAAHRTVENLLNPGKVPPYRDEKIIELLDKVAKAKWVHKLEHSNTAHRAQGEIKLLRKRIQAMAVEISEWRFKVGGANFSEPGNKFATRVITGMRERGYSPVYISDDDFKG